MDTPEVLQQLGLEEREADIYLALLKKNQATATQVAQDVGIDRTTTYDVLARMLEKGLVSYVITNNTKHFSPAPPEQLKQDLEEKQEQLESILPNLLALQDTSEEQTKVEVFKGKEGIITVLKTILRDKQDYLLIGGAHEICRAVPIFMQQFLKRAEKARIKGTLVVEQGFGEHPEDLIGEHETYRIIGPEYVSSTIKVWSNKTAFFLLTKPYHAILIENKSIADKQRAFFKHLWEQAETPSKKHREKVRNTSQRKDS